MRLEKLCFITNMRKRRILKLLPETEHGTKLGIKIVDATYHNKNPYLSVDDLELLSELIGTSHTAPMFKEEIERTRIHDMNLGT